MEFTVDNLFDKTTQDSLDDTMWDLINDLLGGFITAAIGMLYVRYSKPDARKRLARPLGEVFGLGQRIDRLRERFESRRKRRSKGRKKGAQRPATAAACVSVHRQFLFPFFRFPVMPVAGLFYMLLD